MKNDSRSKKIRGSSVRHQATRRTRPNLGHRARSRRKKWFGKISSNQNKSSSATQTRTERDSITPTIAAVLRVHAPYTTTLLRKI